MNVSMDSTTDLKRLFQPTNSKVQSTSNGHTYSLIDSDVLMKNIIDLVKENAELKQLREKDSKKNIQLGERLYEVEERLNLETLHVIDLENEVMDLRRQVPYNDEIRDENIAITWLREHELLCDTVITLIAIGACVLLPEFAIPIVLANSGCVTFIRYVVQK